MSLLLRRRMLIANVVAETTSLLPKEYQQVEYIQSTGTQFIDTKIIGDITISVYAKTNLANGTIIGSQNAENSNKAFVVAGSSPHEFFRILTSTGTNPNISLETIEFYEFYVTKLRADVYVGETNEYVSISPLAETTDLSLFIFARNVNGKANSYTSRKLYKLTLRKNDVIIRDFIPCYRKSDSVIGLYDLIENKFYINEGTGKFLKGADV